MRISYNNLMDRLDGMFSYCIRNIIIADTKGRVFDYIKDWDLPYDNTLRSEVLEDFREYDTDTILLVYDTAKCYNQYDEWVYSSLEEFDDDH